MNAEGPKANTSAGNDLRWFFAILMCVPGAVALILLSASLFRSERPAQPLRQELSDAEQRLLQSRTKAGEWMANANAVFSCEWGGVRLTAPESSKSTNGLLTLPDFQHALNLVPERDLAVISTYAMGFDTNSLTNAVMQLRQCGFREVRVAVLAWGAHYAGPEL